MLEDHKSQVDALLASYKATKDEISRRSALQWAIIGGYAFILYRAFGAVMKPDLRFPGSLAWPTVVWATSAVALLFHRREQAEIMRLSNVISELIESRLANLGLNGVLFERFGFREEEAPHVFYPRRLASRLDLCFNVALFLISPIGLTVVAGVKLASHSGGIAGTVVAVMLLCAFANGYLLALRMSNR